jgi:hypothetical protein
MGGQVWPASPVEGVPALVSVNEQAMEIAANELHTARSARRSRRTT